MKVIVKNTEYPVFELFQDVEITHKLERQYSEGVSYDTTICVWDEVKLDQPLKGKVVGKRRLSDGVIKQNVGGPKVYTNLWYKTAYLVVTSIGRNPVKVLPNRIKEQNETDLN